ncbi:MAG: hypothetical protein ACLGIN_15240 [Candidatus Sericytochromatia bacterium]
MSIKLAYMKIVTLSPGAFAGGLMIVDERGLPVDFRYTDPVQPSRVQQILYGKSLERHVRQDVIFKHLVEKLEPRPSLLLVDDDLLLGLPASTPVAMVVETRLAPLHEAAERQTISDHEYLLQVGETGSPVRIKIGKDDPALADKVAELLLEVVEHGLDPTEPFGRIRGAVDALCAPSLVRE